MTGRHSIDDFHQMMIRNEFSVHKKLMSSMEEHIQSDQQQFRHDLEQAAAVLEDEELRQDLFEFYAGDDFEYEQFKTISMHSLFVASVSLFELRFVRICERAQRQNGNPIGIADLGQFQLGPC